MPFPASYKPRCAAWLVMAALAPAAVGQADESRVLAEGAEKLRVQALRWADAGYPSRARHLWREVIEEYAPDDPRAREALGYVRSGTVWVRAEEPPFPRDDSGAPARAAALERRADSLARELGKAHRDLADELAAGGAAERARYHYRRALRFVPDDEHAGAALGWRRLDGIWGTPAELEMIVRARRLRQTAAFLADEAFAVEAMPDDARHPLLERAGVTHRGVRSAHFEVWGDLGPDALQRAAQWAERCLWFGRAAFGERRGFADVPARSARLALFRDLETWKRIVQASSDLFEPAYLRFLLESCRAAALERGTERLYACVTEDEPRMLDQVVRVVATDLAELRTAGMQEGIGLAVVGMFFGRNLSYGIGLPPPPDPSATASTREREHAGVLAPDVEAWVRATVDDAWEGDGVPMAGLPLVRADRFELRDRVKAWAVCDYLLRREPDLLRALDEAGQSGDAPAEVDRAFARLSDGLALSVLETDWRRFYLERRRWRDRVFTASPSLRPLDRAAEPWFAAINRQRLELGRPPLGWLACPAGAASAFASAFAKPAPLPAELAPFARHALAARGRPDAVAGWMAWPGHRHALLDPVPRAVGFAVHAGVAVFDLAAAPAREAALGRVRAYPDDGQRDVPRAVEVSDLGPEMRALLGEHGHAASARLGYPLTLHRHGGEEAALEDVRCVVRCGEAEIEGFVHVSAGGFDRRIDAPGLATFYPLAPLPADAAIDVAWSFAGGGTQTRFRTGR